MALVGPTAVWVASGQREARPLKCRMLERFFTIFLFILSTDCQGILIIYYYTSNRENYDIENMSDKLELRLQGESVDGQDSQEAIDGSSIDQ